MSYVGNFQENEYLGFDIKFLIDVCHRMFVFFYADLYHFWNNVIFSSYKNMFYLL